MKQNAILWQGLYWRGHEAARLFEGEAGPRLAGTAVFAHENAPCRLDYQIDCDVQWQTRHVIVRGWVGEQEILCEIVVDNEGRWQLNGVEVPAVAHCIDIDLNFSPVTNTLPLRRAHLPIGEEVAVTAAWLRFPDFELVPLDQTYRRTDETHYHYTSNRGSFVAELTVNEVGLVVDYPNLWRAEVSET